jgi:phosphotriesterase-related protein
MANAITVTGEIAPSALGRTLVHEHLHLASPGWEADTLGSMPSDRDVVERGVDMVEKLKDRGVDSFIDPLPGNMGRRIDLVAEIAARTRFNIIAATGLFAEAYAGTAYWKSKWQYQCAVAAEDDYIRYVADVFVNEIVNGVGPDRIRCGIIKVASHTEISPYEMATLKAAAQAQRETGVPITTHSDDGILGAQQQRVLLELGVPTNKIIIGHSCNTSSHGYHRSVVDNGSFIAFDRFGYAMANSDENRIVSLLQLLEAGGLSQILVSNDGVCTSRDTMQPQAWGDFMRKQVEDGWHSLHFHDAVLPELERRGVGGDIIRAVMVDNPRRLFEAAPAMGSAYVAAETAA